MQSFSLKAGEMKYKKLIFLFVQLLVSISNPTLARSCEVRGVSKENCQLYTDDFYCPSTKQIIAFDLVNDDYCDCPDSILSDEPGTSACSSSMFHCENIGSFPIDIRSSIVNDGICDCCDGTDEWLYSNSCVNDCAHEALQTYQALRNELSELQNALTARDELVRKASEVITLKETDLKALKDEVPGLQTLLKEQEGVKEAAKASKEKAKKDWFSIRDKDKDIILESSDDEEEEEEFEDEHEDTFCKPAGNYLESCTSCKQTDCNLSCKCNDGRGRDTESEIEVTTCENFAIENIQGVLTCLSKLNIPPPPECQPKGNYINSCKDCTQELCELKCQCHDGWMHKPSTLDLLTCDDTIFVSNNLGVLECVSPANGKPRKLTKKRIKEWQNDNTPQMNLKDKSPEEKLWREKRTASRDAQRAYDKTQNKIKSNEVKITEMEKFFEYDLGEDNILASFSKCVSEDIGKYTYEICAFEKVTQIEHTTRTDLGKFKELKRLENSAFEMVYENGKSCWEGLDRSTTVKMICGSKEEIERVEEPETCVYKMQVITPAACSRSRVTELKSELKILTGQFPNLLKLE